MRVAFGFAALLVHAADLHAQEAVSLDAQRLRASAIHALGPITVDGVLDERDWTLAPPIDRFVQIEPEEGHSATESTEVRVVFDEANLYFGIVCHDSSGTGDLRVRDLRRDFDDATNDFFGIAIDAVRDGQSALVFRVNPLGALRDQQTVDGGLADVDFDAVWTARTSRDTGRWIAEIAIPWRTLRYRPDDDTWGINFQRVIRRKNENIGWSPWPRLGLPFRMDLAGLLTGLKPPPPGRNLRIQPYALGEATRLSAVPSSGTKARGEIGLDLKWAVTPSTVLDLTLNPDFGQADVDRQVVNLTRFSVFFPERRQFFLENRGIFSTGNEGRFEPFYSRRIGLDVAGNPIPISAGARFTTRGRSGAFGGLAVAQKGIVEGAQGSQFGVLRYAANLGPQNRVGALLATRADGHGDTNVVAGMDGFWRPSRTSFVRGTLTGSTTNGAGGEGWGGYIWAANEANWGYVGYISEVVTSHYDARSGFILRNDYVRISPAMALDWRPAWRPGQIRRFRPWVTLEHYVSASTGAVQEGFISIRPMNVEFENGATIQYVLQPNWQRPAAVFTPVPGVDVEPGRYDYLRHNLVVQSDPSAKLAVRLEPATGGYFDGRLHTVRTLVQFTPDPRVAVSADYTFNRIEAVGGAPGSITTHLVGLETRLARSPRLQFVSFTQWNTVARQLSINARLAWEYQPLAYVTVIYNDRSPISGLGVPVPEVTSTRQLLVKATWLLQL
jgi:hypothetical protein